jgi:hypothetical protein
MSQKENTTEVEALKAKLTEARDWCDLLSDICLECNLVGVPKGTLNEYLEAAEAWEREEAKS